MNRLRPDILWYIAQGIYVLTGVIIITTLLAYGLLSTIAPRDATFYEAFIMAGAGLTLFGVSAKPFLRRYERLSQQSAVQRIQRIMEAHDYQPGLLRTRLAISFNLITAIIFSAIIGYWPINITVQIGALIIIGTISWMSIEFSFSKLYRKIVITVIRNYITQPDPPVDEPDV